MEESSFPKTPRRLRVVFDRDPLYFITFNTLNRQRILANQATHEAFIEYSKTALHKGIAVGRYVIMPDHIHLFVRFSGDLSLGRWIGGFKRWLSKSIVRPASSDSSRTATTPDTSDWQPGFFDHIMRSDESYAEKWDYVRKNPERECLVARAEDWPFQGTIVRIDRV